MLKSNESDTKPESSSLSRLIKIGITSCTDAIFGIVIHLAACTGPYARA
jgi:hypothetical protein